MSRTATLRKGTIKRIHVNQANLRANRKDAGTRPVFSVRTSKGVVWGHEVDIRGTSKLIHPDKPLSCGARIWIETRAEVRVEGAESPRG